MSRNGGTGGQIGNAPRRKMQHDSDGERLHTIYLVRIPEAGKVSLKAEILAEDAHILTVRPDIEIMHIANGTLDNWSFLETPSPNGAGDRFLARLRASQSSLRLCGAPRLVRTIPPHLARRPLRG